MQLISNISPLVSFPFFAALVARQFVEMTRIRIEVS
jgi:hypothetical protein